MADVTAGDGTQNKVDDAAAQSSATIATTSVATKDQDVTNSDQNSNNDDGQQKPSQSKSDDNDQNNGTKNNSKTRKAARWKQMNQQKKDKKRQKMMGGEGWKGDKDKDKKPTMKNWKKDYDEGKPVTPHVGSFANEDMRKLFNVTIDMPSSTSEGGDDANNDGKLEKAATDADNTDDAPDTDKVPKRKLALLVSFLGTKYSGFQINKDQRTLHAEIELGLFKAGIISKMNFGHPSKYSWSNSARTDKGVHAAAQVVSFKGEMIFHNEMPEESHTVKEQMDAMRVRVNECLPEDVRVIDIERVTRMFCARTSRDKVRYQYMVPSYLLCSREEVQKAFAGVDMKGGSAKAGGEGASSKMTPMEAADIVEETINPEVLSQARSALVDHRVNPEQMDRLKNGLKLFEGTHCFHNYTRRIGADNASSTRYILSFTPLDPITVPGATNEDGSKQPDTQWVPLQVVGQSFLLNQIRKMVSAAVDLARGTVSSEQIEQSLSKQVRMKVNVAPAQGLFLDRSYFELYNKHKVKNAPKHGDSRDRDTLDWVEKAKVVNDGEEEKEENELPPAGEEEEVMLSPAVRRIEEFKNEQIIPHIVQEELKEGNFLQYMYAQDMVYKDEVYGLRQGVDEETKKPQGGV